MRKKRCQWCGKEPAAVPINRARAAQRGLWALPEAQRIAPWEWRHNKNLRSDQVRIEAPAGTCGNKRTCKEMSDCNEAQFYLTQCGLSRLDKDSDGVPCEKLCRRNPPLLDHR